MKRMSILSAAVLTAALAHVSTASAQLVVRAPFVRVQVGGPGVYVRAPFVNLFVPSGPPAYYVVPENPPPGQSVGPEQLKVPPQLVPPQQTPPQPTLPPQPGDRPIPAPNKGPKTDANPDQAPPQPAAPERVLTVEQFAKSFQAKAGSYEVNLLNPVTKQPATVRFTLPEGTPRRVNVTPRGIEFDYGVRRYVRIQFDQDGAEVITR